MKRQILSFTLANENAEPPASYGIDLESVLEIRGYTQATPIPNTPRHIKGAINLRGAIVPLVDLRICFGGRVEYSKFTVVIMVNVCGKTVGLVADGVSDVFSLEPSQILPPPDFGVTLDHAASCIEAVADVEQRLILLLNLRKLLAPDGIGQPSADAIRDSINGLS